MSDRLRLLRTMLRCREFDERLVLAAEEVMGLYHVSIGLEASVAAVALQRRDGDAVLPTYRCHGPLIALGEDPLLLYREIFGRDGGPQRGRAGSLHLASPSRGIPHTSAMVGAGPPIALGLALARKRRAVGEIVFCLIGDGAMAEGAVTESLNIAALHGLPVVFVCDNNAVPAEAHASAAFAARAFTDLPAAFGIRSVAVDARDARATFAVMTDVVQAVRGGSGPCFVEARSAPWPGNATFFPNDGTIPTTLEAAAPAGADSWVADGDPVRNEARRLVVEGLALEDLGAEQAAIRAEMQRAVDAARRAPRAPVEAAASHVWGQAP
jgi:TPP-dependent pyruvate/acetoin dehydrogenase alpha subunit